MSWETIRFPLRHGALRVVTPPAEAAVSVAEMKLQARIDHDYEDDYCAELVEVATHVAETESERALVSRTLEAYFGGWCSNGLMLPLPPATSVAAVEYLGEDDAWHEVDAANYALRSERQPAVLEFMDGFVEPRLSSRSLPVRVRYVAGFGGASAVPAAAKQAIKILAAEYYENREDSVIGTITSKVERGFRALVNSFRIPTLR